jgi:photosystem II stability/assembly factor-like uncharacterized protein
VFRSLTVHPLDPNVLLLGTERNGFVKSVDGGETWTRHRDGLRAEFDLYPEIWDIAFAPSDPSTIMAATLDSPGPISGDFPSVIGGVYVSSDGGETWRQMNCGFPNSRVNSVLFDPDDARVAVAGLEGGEPSFDHGGGYFEGGLYRTEDGGENWVRVRVGTFDHRNGYWVMKRVAGAPSTFITFGMNFNDRSESLGFIRSTDAGATWLPFGQELREKLITSFTVSADGRTLYANEDGTYFGWLSRDTGATWTQSAIVQVNGPVAVSPSIPTSSSTGR